MTETLTIQLSILQDGRGSSSNFMAKILGMATALFVPHNFIFCYFRLLPFHLVLDFSHRWVLLLSLMTVQKS